MYPFNTNANDSISHCHDQSIHCRPLFGSGLGDNNPNSKQEDFPSSSSFFNFPSPYIHYEDDAIFLQHLHDLLLQQQPPLTPADHNSAATAPLQAMNNNNTSADSNQTDADGLLAEYCTKKSEQTPRKRSSKKDRHSKIDTAKGPRDRRMRLSLDVARKFFGLQDMLGFDKASKTVDWLMEKAKPAIRELATTLPHIKHMSCSATVGANSSSSTSECEVVSGILMDESSINKTHAGEKLSREKKLRAPRKSAIFHPLARESRERARARARERTREKWRLDESKANPGGIGGDLTRLRSWRPFENGEESASQTHNMKLSYEVLLPHELEEPSCHGLNHDLEAKHDMATDSLAITGNWSPSIIFNHQQNTGVSQEHQSTEIQFYGKPWEAYSSINLL